MSEAPEVNPACCLIPQRCGGRLDLFATVFEHLAHAHRLLLSQLPLSLLDALANSRQSLHSITSIKSGSVDLVPVPRAAGKPIGKNERAFHRTKLSIDGLQ